MENWQLCPKCKGESNIEKYHAIPCRICDGTGLINMMTGLQPSSMMAKATTTNSSSTDNIEYSEKELSKIYSNKS